MIDRFLLSLLGTATKQNNQHFTIFGEIDSLARSPINFVLANTSEPFNVRCIAQLQAYFGDSYLGRSLRIQPGEPTLIRIGTIVSDVFQDPDFHGQMVTYTLL